MKITNRQMRADILKYLYEQWELDPMSRFEMSELFDPLHLEPPESFNTWNDDTKALWRNLHVLSRKKFINGNIHTAGAYGMNLGIKGLEDHEDRSRPWRLKVWDAAIKPETFISIITLIIGVMLGAYIS